MIFKQNNPYEPNVFYHVYNRGNRKSEIFYEQEDYSRFLSTMKRFLKDYSVILYSYCLMPNHYHLLINSGSSPWEISPFMHRFMTSYSIYFNKKYSFVGRVFQDSYKAKAIYTLDSFCKVREYIAKNPIEANLVRNINDYKWYKEARL